MTPDESQSDTTERRPGRLRSAWAVLRGEAVVPAQIMWEWLEYKQTFNGLLEKFSAALARDARRMKRELEREEPDHQTPPVDGLDARRRMKAELGSRMTGRTTHEVAG